MKNRLSLIGALVFFLLLLGLAFRHGDVLALVMPLLVILSAGIYFGPERLNLRVERTLSGDRVTTGSPVKVKLTITNQGSDLEEVLLRDMVSMPLELIDGADSILFSLKAGETFEWEYNILSHRGYYWFRGVEARASDHSGLFRRQEIYKAEGRVLALPQASKLGRVPIRPQRTKVYSGSIPARIGGQGIDFFGVREHQPGDSPRLINWKVTARHPRTLFSNEFEQERIADVGLILDSRHRSNLKLEKESLFEYVILAAASLSGELLDNGHRVGMLVYGRVMEWTFPGYGKVQKEKILRALSRTEPGGSKVFDRLDRLPTRLFPAQSQLIFITPLLRDDIPTLLTLRAHGYQVLVVSPDPITFETNVLNPDPDMRLALRVALLDRDLMFRELQQAGIQVIDWDVSIPFNNVVHASLSRLPMWRRFSRVS